MKAIVVEDEAAWRVQIKLALRNALPALEDIMLCADTESALLCLEGRDGWQYRLILLDWGFVSGRSVSTAADIADFIHNRRKDAFVIILTGAHKDKRMARDDVMGPLIKAKAAEKIFKHEVSKKLDAPEPGLPKLVAKLEELQLDEKLRQRAVYGFQFQSNFLSGVAQGIQYRFKDRQAVIVKLLYERLLDDFPGEVTKNETSEAIARAGWPARVKDLNVWSPNDEFKESEDGKRFWENHVFHKGAKGRYRLVMHK